MKRILIVEDDRLLRETISEIFSNEGFEVYAADNGDTGILMQRTQNVDLIITDILMPHKDGLEVIMSIRKEFPNTKIIAISGGGRVNSKDYLHIAEKFGCHGTFSKPFDNIELLDKVNELLKD